jgi:hydrogenase nickel incorporation protein HypA/HybF
MHELALCGAIAGIVSDRARGRRVDVIRLRVGELRQVVPDTLAYCWALVSEATPLAGSLLEIDRVAARLHCDACGVDQELDPELGFTCARCAATTVSVIAGEEFLVASIDVAREPVP